MKNAMKKTLVTAACFILLFLFAVPVFAESSPVVASGKCGKNVRWKYQKDGTLTLWGTGATYDYAYAQFDPDVKPGVGWWKFRRDVKKVVVREGITYLGNYLFFEMGARSFRLPSTLTKFGFMALGNCPGGSNITYNGTIKTWKRIKAYDEPLNKTFAATTLEGSEAVGGFTRGYIPYCRGLYGGSTYPVVFIANGGKGTMKKMTGTAGEPFTLPANRFTMVGFTFEGWKVDCTGSVIKDKATVKNLYDKKVGPCDEPDDVVRLYAMWKQNRYTVKFSANGGTGSMTAKKYYWGQENQLPANRFKRTGYTFAGWNTKKDGSGTAYKNRATVVSLSKKDGATVTLYAQWKKNAVKGKVTLSGNDTVTAGFSIRLSAAVTPSSDSVTYSSSNTGVATVSSSGKVRGVSSGTAVITVRTSSGATAKKTITVKSNAKYFYPSSSVGDYGSGVRIVAKKLSYSGGNLVLRAYVVNNTRYTVNGYNYVKASVSAGGSRIASQRFGTLRLDLAPYSVREVKFTFDDAEWVNLRNGASASLSGTYWYH